MTEQTPQDEAREEEKKTPEPRHAVRWVVFALATSSYSPLTLTGWRPCHAGTESRTQNSVDSPGRREHQVQRNRRGVINGHLTLTRTQYAATVGNRGNKRPLIYAEFANPCNAEQPLTADS